MSPNLRFLGKAFGFLLLVIMLLPVSGNAQLLGLANSNFVGTHSLYTNPSAIADARQAFYINLFAVDAGVTNNYFRYESDISIFKRFKNDLPFEGDLLKENLNGKPKLFTFGADLRGPALMVRLSPKQSIGFTTRVRGGMQINNLSEKIAKIYKLEGGDDSNAEDLINQVSENNSMNLNANVYSEIGVSYARVLFDKENHFLKAGVSLKKLAGAYSAHLINEDVTFKVREERGVNGTEDYVLELNRIKTKYGYLTGDALGDLDNIGVSEIKDIFLGNTSAGNGWGADVGFTYEFRPHPEKYRMMLDGKEVIDHRKSKYKYRVGFSLMDLGGINYKTNVAGYDLDKTNKELRLTDFEDDENTEDYAETINRALGITAADKVTSFRSGLPTALNLNFDYKIAGPLYANATWTQGLRGKNAISMRQNSLLAVTPRIELRALEIATPIALQNNYQVLTVGAMVKLGPFFIGSDNIGGAFNFGNPYGANVYTGLAFAIAPKKNKDKDKDGVSNSKDKCKTIPGTSEMFGCPDKDKDGVADKEDSCPEIAGTVELKGCPLPESPKTPATEPSSVKPQPVDTTSKTPAIPLEKKTADSVKVAPSDSVKVPVDSAKVPTPGIIKPASATQVTPVQKSGENIPAAITPAASVPAVQPVKEAETKKENSPVTQPVKKDEMTSKKDNSSVPIGG